MLRKHPFLSLIILLSLIYLIGPRVDRPEFDHKEINITMDLQSLKDSLNSSERYVPNIKEDNEARIIWVDSIPRQTEVALVYLHGFTASQEEGDPVHREFAKRYGCNLYLARLNYHGRDDEEALQFMTAEGLYEDTKRAVAIGKQLGKEVVLMSTSTGGTLALLYASAHDDVKGIINYSPNIRIKQKASYMLDKPWGLQLARWVYGGKYKLDNCEAYEAKYWNCKTRLEAIIQLQALVDEAMVEENFNKIKSPCLNAYYYENEEHNDPTVSTEAIEWMHAAISTPTSKKWLRSFPGAKTHVIANKNISSDWQSVMQTTFDFAEQVLDMRPLDP